MSLVFGREVISLPLDNQAIKYQVIGSKEHSGMVAEDSSGGMRGSSLAYCSPVRGRLYLCFMSGFNEKYF